MKIFQFIFYFTLVVYVCPERIQEGKNVTDPTKFPFFAMFMVSSKTPKGIGIQICGSSLIHPQWILTAGHCLPNDTKQFAELIHHDSDVIFMGSIYVQSTPERQGRKIIEIHRHPDYVYDHKKVLLNDIALLKLNTPFILSNTIQTVRLSTSHRECEYIIGIGIGLTTDTGDKPSEVVKYAKLQVKHLIILGGSKTKFFAQSNHESEDSGNTLGGDSGGPFICAEVFPPLQIGVLSAGITTNSGENYDSIERVDFFIDFIKQHLPKDNYTEYLTESKKKEQLRSSSKGTNLIFTILYMYLFFICVYLEK